MYKPDTMILTAGPSITERERGCVADAVANGWNQHWGDYLRRFEKALADYLGVKHVLAVSHGTAALHLAMRLFDIRPGDEVIVPDITYVACANVVRYMGATPVFADVDSRTWCLSPGSVEKNLTPRTRAIMPVWMYGNAPDMDEIMAIARKYNLFVVEDSCPALGTIYKDKKAGAIGDIGAFSFQGAKIAATGEGGALVTNNTDFYERARSVYDHGVDHGRQFWAREVGYMYEMSNVQAALGLAQVERIEELVEAKRRIFEWYRTRLAGVSFVRMNLELRGVRSNMWMSSIVLQDNAPVTRDQMRAELRNRLVDTRPFFFPITMFPMYIDQQGSRRNPHSYFVGLHGINLPSGVMLTEEIVDYVAKQVREILLGKEK